MAQASKIEWTDVVWNPVRGCTRVSEGCRNCYAERQASRFSGPGQPYEGLARRSPARWTGEVRFVDEVLRRPLSWRKPRRVFVNSMSDLFHDKVTDAQIRSVFEVMAAAPQHAFQVLTKRPQRMVSWLHGLDGTISSNVWLGVSVEDQQTADERVPLLKRAPCAVRWVSAEPLLGPVVLPDCELDWVVVGGESGNDARPMRPEWATSLRDQCAAQGTAFFFKQWGEWGWPDQFVDSTFRDLDCSEDGAAHDWVHSHGGGYSPQKLGKRATGALLDGLEYQEYPEVA